jgi:hypothetical protein
VLAGAKGQAKKALDEATARATAIHDGAERRLSLLSTRHSETIKRLTDILDGVSSLVTAEAARLSLEDEVDQNTAKTIAAHAAGDGARPAQAGPNGPSAPGGPPGPGSGGPAGSAAAAASRTATQPLASPVSAGPGSTSTGSTSTGSTSTGPARPAPASPPQSPAQQAEDKRPPIRAAVIDSDDTKPNGVRVMPGSDK